MIQTITKGMFADAFKTMGRGDNFSYDGLAALFDYLEGLEGDTGTPVELDVIAICCEFREYEDLQEFNTEYDNFETIEAIQNETILIPTTGDGFIIQQF